MLLNVMRTMLSGTAIPIHGLASNGGRILDESNGEFCREREACPEQAEVRRAESASFAMSAASFLRKERIGQLFSK